MWHVVKVSQVSSWGGHLRLAVWVEPCRLSLSMRGEPFPTDYVESPFPYRLRGVGFYPSYMGRPNPLGQCLNAVICPTPLSPDVGFHSSVRSPARLRICWESISSLLIGAPPQTGYYIIHFLWPLLSSNNLSIRLQSISVHLPTLLPLFHSVHESVDSTKNSIHKSSSLKPLLSRSLPHSTSHDCIIYVNIPPKTKPHFSNAFFLPSFLPSPSF
jgi:hypothetical protein